MTTQLDFGHIPERTIGRRLRDAREDTGMSQREFAEATGLSQRSISRYEQARHASEVKRPVLLSWAFATNVPLTWLETGEKPGPSNGPGLTLLPHRDSNTEPFDYRFRWPGRVTPVHGGLDAAA